MKLPKGCSTAVYLCLLSLCCTWLANASAPDALAEAKPKLRVAIIGSGIGGAATAYELSKRADVSITVFEAANATSGRLQEAILDDGRLVEMGGTIGIEDNRYFVQYADLLGLTRVTPDQDTDSVGVWDGRKFRFVLDGSIWSAAKGLWRCGAPACCKRTRTHTHYLQCAKQRYHMQSHGKSAKLLHNVRLPYRYGVAPFAAKALVQRMVKRFMRVYTLQAEGRAFDTSAELWDALGLEDLTRRTLQSYLHGRYSKWRVHLISERFIAEVVAVMSRVNYNQSPSSITALAGLVAMAADGSVFNIANGTSRLPAGLLERSGATVHLETPVSAVRPADGSVCGADGPCRRQWRVELGSGKQHTFDAVVIAAPMELAGIKVSGGPRSWPPQQAYETVWTTYVRGRLRPGYFHTDADDLPTLIGTAQHSTAPFRCVSLIGGSGNGTHALYKLFSAEDVAHQVLPTVFERGAKIVAAKDWKAYPHYSAPERLGQFRVAQGLYYTSAIEAGASCIEISAIAGVNAAQLIVRDFPVVRACGARGAVSEAA